jgi:putative ABC transport system permease protein
MSLDGFRIAARTLRKQPVFTTVVVLSLALGIALNTAMYSVLDALIRPGIVALGATSRDILHAVLRDDVVVGLFGAALGLLMTKYGVLLLGGFVIEDDVFNAPLFAAVAGLLGATVATSAFIPALRATRIDPTESLRHE